MNIYYDNAKLLMEHGEFNDAGDLFAKSYRDGYLKRNSLLYYSNCKFMQASLDFEGTGFFSGLPRRSLLISASSALRDGLNEFGEDADYLFLACCVEYALGLLLTTKNGFTQTYRDYQERLRSTGDSEMLNKLYEFLPVMNSTYTEVRAVESDARDRGEGYESQTPERAKADLLQSLSDTKRVCYEEKQLVKLKCPHCGVVNEIRDSLSIERLRCDACRSFFSINRTMEKRVTLDFKPLENSNIGNIGNLKKQSRNKFFMWIVIQVAIYAIIINVIGGFGLLLAFITAPIVFILTLNCFFGFDGWRIS